MQVTVESTGALERKMRVELPAERIEKEVESRLKRVGRTAKIKGFRPGKVPPKVIRQRYGSQVRQEVLTDLMGQSYRDAVQQENLNPVAQPQIEPDMAGGGDAFAYTATFEVLPEFSLQGLDKIEVTVPKVEIEDSDIDDMLDNLRRQKADWETVERKSAKGDRVVVDFEGKLKGEVISGGQGTEVPVVLGEGQMLPDFEEALYGVKADEEKSFKVKFPKDYQAEELQGKKSSFRSRYTVWRSKSCHRSTTVLLSSTALKTAVWSNSNPTSLKTWSGKRSKRFAPRFVSRRWAVFWRQIRWRFRAQ